MPFIHSFQVCYINQDGKSHPVGPQDHGILTGSSSDRAPMDSTTERWLASPGLYFISKYTRTVGLTSERKIPLIKGLSSRVIDMLQKSILVDSF